MISNFFFLLGQSTHDDWVYDWKPPNACEFKSSSSIAFRAKYWAATASLNVSCAKFVSNWTRHTSILPHFSPHFLSAFGERGRDEPMFLGILASLYFHICIFLLLPNRKGLTGSFVNYSHLKCFLYEIEKIFLRYK